MVVAHGHQDCDTSSNSESQAQSQGSGTYNLTRPQVRRTEWVLYLVDELSTSSDEEATGPIIASTAEEKEDTVEEHEGANAPASDVVTTDLTKVDGAEPEVDSHSAVDAEHTLIIASPEAGLIGQTEAPFPDSASPPEDEAEEDDSAPTFPLFFVPSGPKVGTLAENLQCVMDFHDILSNMAEYLTIRDRLNGRKGRAGLAYPRVQRAKLMLEQVLRGEIEYGTAGGDGQGMGCRG